MKVDKIWQCSLLSMEKVYVASMSQPRAINDCLKEGDIFEVLLLTITVYLL